MRVTGDPEAGNDGLFYIHSDHLGRTSVLTRYSDGYIVSSSLTRYPPFGRYRTGGPNQITDRAFTGQRENMALGLYYYNARYYAPYIYRMISPDTIVPDPQNPQSLNRYTYTLNSPLNYSDPTGHRPSDGCKYEGCTLPDFMNPNQTWQDANGTYLPYDPAISEQFLGDFTLEEAAFGVAGLAGVAAFPITAEYVAGQVIWPTLAKTGTAIVSWLCLGDGDCTNEVQSIDPNKLNHIFGKVEHNLDQFLQSYGGDQEAAYQALQTEYSNLANNYTIQQLNQGVQVTVNGFNVTVTGTIVDGVARIGTAFIPPP